MVADMDGPDGIRRALQLVGELLAARGERIHIVVIGGAAVNLLGFVRRATTDVDILAFAREEGPGPLRLTPPEEPLPKVMRDAAAAVASDLGLDPNWLNAGPAPQWSTGLPDGLAGRVTWRDYGGLVVGLAGRFDLIHFKLYAAADDRGPESVHFQDLLALRPSDADLETAALWVRTQDPSPEFAETLSKVIDHARRRADHTR